jgi:hypothetical protein
MAALHEQSQEPDAMDGEDKKDGYFYAGSACVLWLQRALGYEWAWVVHVVRAQVRQELRFGWFGLLSHRGFPSKNPEANKIPEAS